MTCTNPDCTAATPLPGLCERCRTTRRRLLGGLCVWCGRELQADDTVRCADCRATARTYTRDMARLVKRYQDMRFMQRLRGAA